MEPGGVVTRAMQQKQLLAHWQTLRPDVDQGSIAGCVRCAEPSAPTCRFHPDAKAFAFGSGRFDYDYNTFWDTPHGGLRLACMW